MIAIQIREIRGLYQNRTIGKILYIHDTSWTVIIINSPQNVKLQAVIIDPGMDTKKKPHHVVDLQEDWRGTRLEEGFVSFCCFAAIEQIHKQYPHIKQMST